jgi:uracil DNA glycosylase
MPPYRYRESNPFARLFKCANTPRSGSLRGWAEQGVLLVNAALTVAPRKSGNPLCIWSAFSTQVLRLINRNAPRAVFIVWGVEALNVARGAAIPGRKIVAFDHPCASTARPSSFRVRLRGWQSSPAKSKNTLAKNIVS